MDPTLSALLAKGDMRTKGAPEDAVRIVLASRDRIDELIAGVQSPDSGMRMCSADAIVKVSEQRPEWLATLK